MSSAATAKLIRTSSLSVGELFPLQVYHGALMKILRLLLACLFLSSVAPVFCQSQSFTLEQIMGAPFSSELTAARQNGHIAWVD